jgi:hypothetical protein
MKKAIRNLSLITSVSAAGILAACGGGGGSTAGQGTLSVAMTDAPACGFDKVNVTVSKVRAHKSGGAEEGDGGWTDITLNPARKIDLLNLTNGILEELGEATLEEGRYNQLRLVLAPNTGTSPFANSVVPTGGTETALATPSGIRSGIKLNGNFDITANAKTSLTLDFDACKSIVTRGNGSYGLKPVISVIPMATSGAINGYIDPALASSAKPVVSAQVDGVIVKSTVPTAAGAFSLSPLTEGTYTVVVTADSRASSVISGVPVSVKGTTAISTSGSPITLVNSAENVVSGKISPASAEPEIRATQSFASGPTVTIKYQNADVTTGAYSLTLPTGAAYLGQYGNGTLPINLTAQAATAGKYTMEASAAGYQTQSSPVDVTNAAVTKDFTLVK